MRKKIQIMTQGFTLIRTLRRKNLFTVQQGFTLIELLVTISIIGILIGLSVFGLQGARQSSRDARRKADLEQIRSGIEIYKSDCNNYPASISSGANLKGDNSSTSCSSSNIYISSVPGDPVTAQSYPYSGGGTTYVLCATLENPPNPPMDVQGCNCATCNYKVTNP